MLVIDRIKLTKLNEIEEMRKLQRNHPLRLQRRGNAQCEIIDVWHMSEDIDASDQISLAAFAHQTPRQRFAEKFAQYRHAQFFCRRRCAGGGFNAKARHASGYKILEQIAVVRSYLNHQTLTSQAQAMGDFLAVVFGMGEPARGGAGEIGVGGTE